MRQAMLAHPWAASLIGRMPALGPNALGVTNRMREGFMLAGFEGLEVDYAVGTLTAYVFGMTIPEVSYNAYLEESQPDQEEVMAAITKAAAAYPDMLDRIKATHRLDPRAMREMSFDFGLSSVLDGLEARLVT